MNDLNSVTLEGRATRDAELSYTSGGAALAKFSLAVNRSWKAGDEWKEEVAFIDCVAWAALAESVAPRIKKGAPLLVVGRLKMDQWQDHDGNPRSRLSVVAEHVGESWRPARKEA